jgi:dephospho-CoA kinase
MLKSKKVAVTGTLASGKSSVCHFFKQLGAHTVSADQIVHELLSDHTDLVNKVTRLLGDEVLTKGKLSREAIADKVFNDPHLLLALEELLHPHVFERISAEGNRAKGLFIAEVPLLFEATGEGDFDTTIAVVSSKGQERSGLSAEAFERRSARQLSAEEKAARADITIHNDGSLEELREAVTKIYKQLTKQIGHS